MKSLTHYNEFGSGKLLEGTFGESPRFTQEIDRKNGIRVDIDNPPVQWQSPYVLGGRAEWTMDVSFRESGIEIGSAYLKSLRILFEIEDPETGESGEEIEIELGENEISWEDTTSQIGRPDWYLNSIEIDMQGNKDPQTWKYYLDIGN